MPEVDFLLNKAELPQHRDDVEQDDDVPKNQHPGVLKVEEHFKECQLVSFMENFFLSLNFDMYFYTCFLSNLLVKIKMSINI